MPDTEELSYTEQEVRDAMRSGWWWGLTVGFIAGIAGTYILSELILWFSGLSTVSTGY